MHDMLELSESGKVHAEEIISFDQMSMRGREARMRGGMFSIKQQNGAFRGH